MSRTIYVDLDGVLVDFDRFKREYLSARAQVDDAAMWAELQEIPNVFRMMKATPYAAQLWIAVRSTGLPNKILTAIPRRSTMPNAENNKRDWVLDHKDRIFLGSAPEVLIGPHSKDKWRHCRPGDILIDDREDNCAAWETAGGFTVHHTGDIHATIQRLRWLVNQQP
jgi:hypothetical protein